MAEQFALPGLAAASRTGFRLDSFWDHGQEAVLAHLRAFTAGRSSDSQILLWGSAGSGKSHLLQGATVLAQTEGNQGLYLPASVLLEQGVGSLEGLFGLPWLALDDVDLLCSERDWAQALYLLISEMRQAGGRLLLSASNAPEALNITLPDLRSRLGWGAVYRLLQLDDAGKQQALMHVARYKGLELMPDAAQFLLRYLGRDWSTLIMSLERLDQASWQHQRKLTIPFIRDVLGRPDLF